MKYVVFLGASLLVLLAAGAADLETIKQNGQDCGPEGTGVSPAGKDLNRHKNRFKLPEAGDIDADVSLPAMLAPGKDVKRFDQEKAARVRGLVIDVQVGGNHETCNCGATDPDERDTHIPIALAAGVPETQQVIIEVTPRLRLFMKDKGVDWRTPALQDKIKGKWIEATGWLLFDTAHIKEAENTNPGHQGNWRATCWEIHPVTSITILDEPPPEAAGFQPASFTALQRLHTAHMARVPNGQAALMKFHEDLLSKFDKKERDEAEEETKLRTPKP
jgi:hypothetical protein